MKLIYEPTVEVIAQPTFRHSDEPSTQEWVFDPRSQDPEDLIEFAGRACYRSWKNPGGKTNAQYIEHILESQHYSVLEHASYSLWITGISRSLSHELVRHRHLSFSQESQRFVPASDVAFVVPPAFIGDAVILRDFTQDCEGVVEQYGGYLDYLNEKFAHLPDGTSKKKQAREAARAILPNATETRITVSGNLRSWREFVQKRATLAADAEICRLAVRIFRTLQPLAPAVWQDMRVQVVEEREIVVPR